MRVVTPLDLRKRLGELLDAASAGERFLIERNGKPLAMLVSVEDGRRATERSLHGSCAVAILELEHPAAGIHVAGNGNQVWGYSP